MSTNDEVRDELPNTTEDAPAVQSSIGQPSTVNSDDDDFVDPPPPAPRQVQRTSKGGDNGKQDVKTTKRKAATVAAKKICQSSKNVPKGKVCMLSNLCSAIRFFYFSHSFQPFIGFCIYVQPCHLCISATSYLMQEVVSEKQYSTIRCSPGFICELISLIKGDLRKRVSAMGFAKLFEMNMNKLKDRVLAMFLTSCVKEDPLRLQVVGKHLLITPQAVSRVLGIPLGGESLPSWTVAQCREARAELRGICDAKGLRQKYERRSGDYTKLGVSEVPRWFIEEAAIAKDTTVDDWAVQSFFILIFNALLFPTGSDKIVGIKRAYPVP